MKKSIVLMLCLVGFIASLFALQNYDQRRLNQVMDDCRGKIAVAQLDGKSSQEVCAFLDEHKISHDPYTGLKLVSDEVLHRKYKQGWIDAYPGPYIYLFKWPGGDFWHVRTTFNFDEQNKYRSSFVYAEGRR